MNAVQTAVEQPPLLIAAEEYDRLRALAMSALDQLPEIAGTLLEEVERATVLPVAELPADVVRLGSQVTYQDERSGSIRTVRVVLPHEADISAQRVSVLTPIGAALIGLREGQRMRWTLAADGEERHLRVVRVMAPGEQL